MDLHPIRTRELVPTNGGPPKRLLFDPDDRMISLQEAADRTGVSLKRIKMAIDDGELRIHAFGPGTKRVLLSDLQK